jgi:uncharacterized protein YdiU (UPF0061 family)
MVVNSVFSEFAKAMSFREQDTAPKILNKYSERLSKEFGDAEDFDNQRMERMQSSNPRYILRNWIAQQVMNFPSL